MQLSLLKYLMVVCLFFFGNSLTSQQRLTDYVNPFIGTAKTKVNSRWGGEGGTFPGAAAPGGFIQLSPETRVTEPKGYDYPDTTIFFFSCLNHLSGYPEGSAGRIRIMPVNNLRKFTPDEYCRPFRHSDEMAEPAYYRVKFSDDGTMVETTASVRTGMFRITFPKGISPELFVSDAGKISCRSVRIAESTGFNAVFVFNRDIAGMREADDGYIFSFSPVPKGKNELILKVGASLNNISSTRINLEKEADTWNFDHFRQSNLQRWMKALSVIEIEDSSETSKTIFYTALYHSLLIPWIISDVNGNYRGADGKIHQTKGNNQYSAFSPWDTFRSLHPLLCLIAPGKQRDILFSVLDQFEQSGKLPKGPMTGNHMIPVIVDSYMKGIRGFDTNLAYRAMKTTLSPTSENADFMAYCDSGFVPSSFSESVTRTVEYAYDDWALAQFAGCVMKDTEEENHYRNRSLNYRNLFDTETLFLLPRRGNDFIRNPGNSGYKEGDQWTYSLFIPHNPGDLINLSGGNDEFSNHLDSALEKEYIIFDNEPVFHIPWLFNYADHPQMTQQWVRKIMQNRFTNSADGLPGNDDLGSLSSWYVFSALGFYPVCPGKPEYDLGSPLFSKATIHPEGGKKFIIKAEKHAESDIYVQSSFLNGKEYNQSRILHSAIMKGGELLFSLDDTPAKRNLDAVSPESSATKGISDIRITYFHVSRKQVEPGEPFHVVFTLSNTGETGTKVVRLYLDGKEYLRKNCLTAKGDHVTDSMECRLYPVGLHDLSAGEANQEKIEVTKPLNVPVRKTVVTGLKCPPVFKTGNPVNFVYKMMNQSGFRDSAQLRIYLNNALLEEDTLFLDPGETRAVEHPLSVQQDGFHHLRAGSLSIILKTYSENSDSKVIDISAGDCTAAGILQDKSGFSNNGSYFRENAVFPLQNLRTDSKSFVRFEDRETLSQFGESITVMAWIYPLASGRGLMDIITKGDFIVFQTSNNQSLSFFAGGWGRGSCTVPLPGDWMNRWHHIAGVSDGKSLKIFIDGKEAGSAKTGHPVNLSSPARWMIGRNEEFPDQRYFTGLFDQIRIFTEPLTASEINKEMQINLPENK